MHWFIMSLFDRSVAIKHELVPKIIVKFCTMFDPQGTQGL